MKNISRHSQSLFAFVLYLMFFTMTLIFLVSGVSVYRNIMASMEENYSARTCLSYISTKIRQCDNKASVSIVEKSGTNALVLQERAGALIFETWIYFYEGGIFEIYIEKDTPFELSDGDRLLSLKSIDFKKSAGGIYIKCQTEYGISDELFLSLNG